MTTEIDSTVVEIDASRCQGHGRCVVKSPNVFGWDDEGYGRVLVPGGIVPVGELAAVLSAIADCPERAITTLRLGAGR